MEPKTEHRFWLRPDFLVAFALPSNVTQEEVDKLATAVRTLPFQTNYRDKIKSALDSERVLVAQSLKLWTVLEWAFGEGRVPVHVRQMAERLCGGSVLFWQSQTHASKETVLLKLREIAEAL
jgi:hypothetical protein